MTDYGDHMLKAFATSQGIARLWLGLGTVETVLTQARRQGTRR
jgi:hypothetical protein